MEDGVVDNVIARIVETVTMSVEHAGKYTFFSFINHVIISSWFCSIWVNFSMPIETFLIYDFLSITHSITNQKKRTKSCPKERKLRLKQSNVVFV